MAELLYVYEIDGAEEMAEVLRRLGDVADDQGLVEEDIAELTGIPDVLESVLDEATERNRDLAAYKRRTGDLEDTTGRGEVEVSGNTILCEWGARSEHASFVEKKGFSQTEAVANWAEERLDELLSGG